VEVVKYLKIDTFSWIIVILFRAQQHDLRDPESFIELQWLQGPVNWKQEAMQITEFT